MANLSNDTADIVFAGTSGVDYLYNYASGVTIEGYDGDDEAIYNDVTGNNVVMHGGDGDDNISNDASSVTISGGAGNDTITNNIISGGGSNVKIYGDDGNDYIVNSGDNVTIDGGTGDDYILNVNSNVTISGGAGNDTIFNSNSSDTVTGGEGNDYITLNGSDNIIQYANGDGNDTVSINSGATFTLQVDSSEQPTSVNSGNNLVVQVGEGSITFLDMAGQSLDIVDSSGNTISLTEGTDSGGTDSTNTDTGTTDTDTGATDTDTGTTDTDTGTTDTDTGTADTSTETTDTNTTDTTSDSSLLKGDTDIVFLVDTSGSMGGYITRVKNAINNFVDDLSNERVSVRLGLIDFGGSSSIYENSLNETYDFTDDVETFKNNLASLSTTGYAEYGLSAIDAALAMDFRDNVTKRFIMLTDEGYEENNSSDSLTYVQASTILSKLNYADVVLDVVGKMDSGHTNSCYDEYKPIANATGGDFYDISTFDYTKIFETIAEDIVGQIEAVTVNLNDVSDGEAGVFLITQTTDENGATTFSTDTTFISLGFAPYQYNGHYYGIYTNQSSWEDAKAFCEYMGGHLAVINDEAENIALYDYMKSQGYDSAFFGLSDAESEGNWKWVNGDEITYVNCAEGEPNGGTSENYAMFVPSVPEYQWVDAGFSEGSAFICEWDISDIENIKVAGTVTNDKIYTADTSNDFRQNIIIPDNWNVTATNKNDTLNVSGDNVTVAGGEGKDSFVIESEADGIVFADISITEDRLSFENAIPERSLDYSVNTELDLFSDDVHLTFQNQTRLTTNFLNYIVSNGDGSNTISELLINPPDNVSTEINPDSSVRMSFSRWDYGFEPTITSSET